MAFIERWQTNAFGLRKRFVQMLSFLKRRRIQSDERKWELNATDLAAYYRARARELPAADAVDERTWSDLELDKVYARLDKSVTPPGAQYLYAFLRFYENKPETLAGNVKAYQTFKSMPAAAQALRVALRDLNRQECAELADFLHGPSTTVPPYYRIFYFLSAISVACPFGLFISAWFIFPTLGLWILNIVLQAVYGRRIGWYVNALKSLAVLLGAVPRIGKALQGIELPEVGELNHAAAEAKRLHKAISRPFLRNFQGDDLTRTFVEYLNLLCLFELAAGCRAIQAVNRERAGLIKMFRLIARLDALQGLAISLADYPAICVPELRSGRSFTFAEVYHPLLNAAVSNNLAGTGNSLLLSGTNMSGKTTFIKTLGLNLVLAQTLGVCLARQAVVPPARVRTLIDRQDTITTGQSYFYFEAMELLRMLNDAGRDGRKFWFVLDEVFRGTNAVERVAAGAAVLNHLNRHGFVIASTHDHQLTDLLRNEFDPYHFSEVIVGNEARFDYHLREGPCTTRNAIKLLGLAGYPPSVIAMAERITSGSRGALSGLELDGSTKPVMSEDKALKGGREDKSQ